MNVNIAPVNPVALKDELEKVKASVQELKTVAFTSNDSLNKKLNDHIERTTRQINQLNSVVEILLKENQELKGILSNQRFVIQPINPFQQGSQTAQSHQNQLANTSQNSLNLPLGDNFLPTNGISSTSGHSEVRSQHSSDQNQQAQSQSQQQQNQQQQQAQQQQTQQAQQAQQGQQSQQQQSQQQQTTGSQQRGSAQRNHQGSTQGQQPSQHHHQSQANGVLDSALGEASTNSGMLRFINNQYVDEEHNLNNQAQASNNSSSRIDFVFMDPSANRSRHYRSGSTNFHDDDQDDEENPPITHLTPPRGSRLQKSHTRHGEFSAENYDLIIHNDFNKVEDIYYEYYNSLKPQVERVQKAYKIKKIRKYQKIKALAVRIDRYKEIKGCSLEESFRFFDNLRLTDDNSKRSIAWLYNTLPDILKRIGLEDQLKKNPST